PPGPTLFPYTTLFRSRGETEFETMAKAMKPGDDDPDFVGKELERLFAQTLVTVLGNWHKAAASPIPIPPENCPTDADKLESAARSEEHTSELQLRGHL